jgi:DsbC/DsbD-like thiol-disulfide interchange protein
MKTKLIPFLCAASFVTGLGTATIPAFATDPLGKMAEVSLLPGWTMPNGHYMAALQVKLAPGWHTYWRAPGAAGIPPQFDWTGSRNIAGAEFHWPIPDIYEQNGMRFLGYETELILPIEFTPSAEGPMTVKGGVTIGVCDEVCMPFGAMLRGAFEIDAPAQNTDKIKAALKHQPKSIAGARCSAKAIDDGIAITATLNAPKLSALEVAVIEHPDPKVWVSESMSNRTGRVVTIESDMVPEQATPFFVDRSQLRITLIGEGGKALEAKGCSGS